MKNHIEFALMVGLAAFTLVVACATLTPADKEQIAKDQVELSVCATEAHLTKLADAGRKEAWAVFDDCMVRKGFYDGGSDAR